MPSAFRVALVGLAPGERSLVEAAFSLPGPDGARHEMVHDPARANLIILDAEDTRAVHHFRARGLAAPVLLIGQDDAHTGWPAIPRPIERHALLGEAARLLSGAPADLEAPPLAPAFQATAARVFMRDLLAGCCGGAVRRVWAAIVGALANLPCRM